MEEVTLKFNNHTFIFDLRVEPYKVVIIDTRIHTMDQPVRCTVDELEKAILLVKKERGE